MTTRTQNDVRNFNEAISKCRMPVFSRNQSKNEYGKEIKRAKGYADNSFPLARSLYSELFSCYYHLL